MESQLLKYSPRLSIDETSSCSYLEGFYMKNYILTIIVTLSAFIGTHSLASEREQDSQIDQMILTLLKKASFNGSAVVATGDNILAQHSLGLADAETKRNLNNQSSFALGSVTKEFNAVAIMILHEKGLLDINQPLSDYFIEMPAWSKQVKIRNLLNYTSGLPRVDFGQIRTADDLRFQVNELSSLEFEPGKGYLYSNHNVFLQIRLIELISKQSYPDFLQEHVFLPLKMNHSYLNNQMPPQVVKSFKQPGANDPDVPFPISAIVHSTAREMHTWLRALHTGKLINSESIKALFEAYETKANSSLGEGSINQTSKRYHFHQGSHFSFEAIIFYDLVTEKSIVLLTNNKPENLHGLFLKVKALVLAN